MSDKFSSVLKLTELDDFITPSQECIKPVVIDKKSNTTNFTIEDDGSYYETTNSGEKKKLEKATITLNDCLACSGCITSAESVLITAQSTKEFLNVISDNTTTRDKVIIVSVSPQSRASLAAHFNLPQITIQKKLETFFKTHLNVSYIFDTGFSREFTLLESSQEFIHKYKLQKEQEANKQQILPLFASSCPGWICYAEKTHGDYILPYISTVKSPQQIMGTIVKEYFASKVLKIDANRIYHVTIMPCYDKKLEASRSDFYNDIFKTRDVDCVLSTTEVIELLKEKNVDFESLQDQPTIDTTFKNMQYDKESDQYKFVGVEGSTGGYFEFLFKTAAKELFNKDIKEIEYKTGRNSDFKEAILEVDGKPALHFVKAYGFRNIQNVVRKIKSGKCPYHYIEVMACPSGCINGGGQIKASSGSLKDQKVVIEKSESRYFEDLVIIPPSIDTTTTSETVLIDEMVLPSTNPTSYIYQSWLHGCFSPDAKTKLHTQYHMIEKQKNALSIKW